MMETKTIVHPWTYQDMLEKLPAESRYEMINGELIDISPAPSPEHQHILKRLFKKLDAFVENSRAGEANFAPYDVILDQNNIVQPDILCVPAGNTGSVTSKSFEGIPDLMVE